MKRALWVLVAFVGVGLASTPAWAEKYEHAEGGIQIDVPSGWSVSPDGEQLSVETPDGSMLILFWVPAGETWEAALDALGEELDKVVKDASVENDGTEGDLNGMPIYEIAGKGKVEGTAVEWSLTLMLAKKPVIALAFAAPGAWEKSHSALVSFVKGIRKVG